MPKSELQDFLPNIGIKTFVEFFEVFKSGVSNKKIIEKFNLLYNWKENVKKTKIDKGRSIFKYNLELDALLYVINDFNKRKLKDGNEVANQALQLYNKYSENNYLIKDLFSKDVETKFLITEKNSLMKIRINQGKFRKDLVEFWAGCSVTGVKNVSLLVASHIKPWRDCDDTERLDKYNGLLLTPNLDKLFDSYLITFSLQGKIIISEKLKNHDLDILNIKKDFCINQFLHENHKKYLIFHNKEFEKRNSIN